MTPYKIMALFKVHIIIHPEAAVIFKKAKPRYEDDIDEALGGF